MKLRKQLVLKIIAGALLMVLVMGIAIVLKDVLYARHPEDALPIIKISYIDTELPAENWIMDSYAWRFLTITKEWRNENPNAWQQMTPAPVRPGMPIEITFSYPCKDLKISRSFDNSVDFYAVGGELQTPQTPGIYTYMIEADWYARGSILYYFKVVVVE